MSFKTALTDLDYVMLTESNIVHSERWQSQDISENPQAAMCEVLHETLKVDLPHSNLEQYAKEIKPNLPWADNHFEERVFGMPLNPGAEWLNWPWSNSADGHRNVDEQFNHNYMERYWPKYAGLTKEGFIPGQINPSLVGPVREANYGIRHPYGDLMDVVKLLASEPSTRQAYLPIWFPEDTGINNSGRKPCTLGYHFIMRDGRLDVVYNIRSCDYYRHIRDDIYMTVRLLIWVLEQVSMINVAFKSVKPGKFVMHITSLHMFVNDYSVMFGEQHHGIK